MILHCAPPYRCDIPNPAVGYLKGFLEAKGIKTKNMYWNLILSQEITNFCKRMGPSLITNLSTMYMTVLHIGRHLLMEPSAPSAHTSFDRLFSLFYTEEEISELITSIKNKIDRYIQENSLHKSFIAGFPLKTHQWLTSYYIIRRLKDMNPDINIVIGGIFDEDQARTFMNVFTLADFAIWGEGEYPLYHLARALEVDTDLNKVPQLVYRDGGTIHSTNPTTEHINLDSYPFADHTDYFDLLKKVVPEEILIFIPIWGSRSCPWNKCKFCVLNEDYTHRSRSPENIVEELEFQFKKYNIDYFVFMDTEFAGNKKRFKSLLKLLVQSAERRGEPYHLLAEASPTLIDAEAAEYMQRASFELLQIGFEGLTDTLLEKMAKRHRFAHNIQALKLRNQYGAGIRGNVIKGIPPETEEDILESCSNLTFLRFFLKNYPILPNPCALHKGSAFYNEMTQKERNVWGTDFMWEEIAPTGFVSESDKFEFFCFYRNEFPHYMLWDSFERLLRFYGEKNSSYTWTEYEDHSVFHEEGSRNYTCTLDRDQTDILIYCDSVKPFSEVRSEFSHIPEDTLRTLVHALKEDGLLYHDKDMHTLISVVEASKRKSPSKAD